VHFIKVDVEEVPDVSQELGVTAMPTFFFFKDGDKVDNLMGAVPPKLEAKISALAA
jgi:thioredoxin 1